MKNITVTLFFVIALYSHLSSQVVGCTDPNAVNYNPQASVNDGSCNYNVTLYNPNLRFLLPDVISETSGLVFYNGLYFTINDSGGLPVLYGIDTTDGNVIQLIDIANASNVDWESLADDDTYIYIGDFGNNSGLRDDLCIYRINKSDIPLEGHGTATAEKISFSYSDFPGKKDISKNHNFDCEAFIASDNWLYLFSKNRGDQHSKLYRLPKIPGQYIAELMSSFDTKGLITGADINKIENEITLVGYVDQSWVPFFWLLFDYDGDSYFSGNKRRIDMPNIVASQTEAVVYTVNKNAIITSEGNILFSQSAFDINTGKWTNQSASSVETIPSQSLDIVLSPNPVAKNKLVIEVKNLPVGEYQIEIFDTLGKLMETNSYKITRHKDKFRIKIRVDDFVKGVYFVRLISEGGIIEKKFIRS